MPDTKLTLLEELLTDDSISRNRDFERFQDAESRHIYRMARSLRQLKKQGRSQENRVWYEHLEDGRICIRIHAPKVNALRSILLTQEQWGVLHRLGWTFSEANAAS